MNCIGYLLCDMLEYFNNIYVLRKSILYIVLSQNDNLCWIHFHIRLTLCSTRCSVVIVAFKGRRNSSPLPSPYFFEPFFLYSTTLETWTLLWRRFGSEITTTFMVMHFIFSLDLSQIQEAFT